MPNKIIKVQNIQINVTNMNEKDYICISDIAKAKSDKSRAADVIRNWLRNRSTLDFLTAWEELYNPNFKVFESEHFRKQVGLLTFTPSITEWCKKTNAMGMYSKMGKYGGTYVRDYATINELTVLSNLESHNAELIKEGKSKEERFEILNEIAKYQLDILNNAEKIKLLGNKNN